MMNSKLNIYRKEWLDVIFAGRNKMYGAYELRNLSDKATNVGLGIVVSFAVLLIAGSYAYNKYFKQTVPPVIYTVQDIGPDMLEEIQKKVEEKEEVPEEPVMMKEKAPQQVAQDVSKFDLVRMPDIKVAKANQVTEELVSQDELKNPNTMTSRITLKASPSGTYIARGEFGSSKRDGDITGSKDGSLSGGGTDDNSNSTFTSVEIMPTPVGGLPAFMKWIAENYNFPQQALDQGVSGVIEVSFVVEKDGSLTDIAVKRDMKFGTGDAAINLLKKAKKWKPGVQNGLKVRVAYTLPIRLSAVSQ
ncbi:MULTISPECIES: energy transducer TonB [Sphingobacterium]|jgi:protein TonB|uniref:Outer membrane transport energization protein TonB n=1 Tax=Sphingobacterium siyangense TaxID=459529 RepID=A0A562MID9_9SPHI|nr:MULTISPECIES: energy transducer TonB [Sphingobacterium]APU96077.1 energy transducer TonB [Sphingobacterium sp. B29]TWI19673.1 outer membrane transport energization protein TonB [Sphingobacterium siyangense]